MTDTQHTGPLTGYRVVDLTSVVSGPSTAVMLADQGAEVIKVEAPAGDVMRYGRAYAGTLAPTFISCNRGKKSIVLDLKNDDAKAVLWKLIGSADVFLQNNRPGAMGRLGFGPQTVCEKFPKLVYASISGVGAQGPYADKRVYDPIIQSLSGLADIQADPLTGRPRMVRTLIADKITGVYTAQAITAALLHRERTGAGQHVEVTMLDAVVSFIWPEGMAPFTAIGHEDSDARNAPHDMIFDTADGHLTVGAISDAEWRALCNALGHPEWIEDPRFLTGAQRSKNRQERLELVQGVLKTDVTETWLVRFAEHDVPSAPVLKRAAAIEHAQVRANDLIVEIDQPGVGPVRQARPAARFDTTPAAIGGVAPHLGADTVQVLKELGYDEDDIERLRSSGATAAAQE